ncbi:hypothetical protein D3C72_2237290 [compost metagenome]
MGQGGRGGPGHLGNVDGAIGAAGCGVGFLGKRGQADYRQKRNSHRGGNATGFQYHQVVSWIYVMPDYIARNIISVD